VSCAQGMPAGFPWGIPGMDDEMDGAMQQAAQPGRHCTAADFSLLLVIPSSFAPREKRAKTRLPIA